MDEGTAMDYIADLRDLLAKAQAEVEYWKSIANIYFQRDYGMITGAQADDGRVRVALERADGRPLDVTTTSETAELERARAEGFTAVLQKPVHVDRMRETLAAFLPAGRGPRTGTRRTIRSVRIRS